MPDSGGDGLMTTEEVARLFGVSTKTVVEWARLGSLPHFWTPGRRRRYRAENVHRLWERAQQEGWQGRATEGGACSTSVSPWRAPSSEL